MSLDVTREVLLLVIWRTFDPSYDSTAPPKTSETEKASQVSKTPDYSAKPKNKVNDPSVLIL